MADAMQAKPRPPSGRRGIKHHERSWLRRSVDRRSKMPPSRVVEEALEAFVRSGVASSRPEVLLWLGEDGMFDNATRYIEGSNMEESVHSERKTKVDSLEEFIKTNARAIDVLKSKSSHRTLAGCRLIEEIARRSQALSAMLEGLSLRQLSNFLRQLQLIELHEGDTIVSQDQPATSLFAIIYGRVRACKGNDEPIYYERGHVVGELAWLFDDNEHTEQWQATYSAASNGLLLKATRSDLISSQSEELWKETTETRYCGLPPPSEVETAIKMLGDTLPKDRARIHINRIARFLRSYTFFQQLPQPCVRAIAHAATLHSQTEVGGHCVLETHGETGQSPLLDSQAASDDSVEYDSHSNCATDQSMFFVLRGCVAIDDLFDDSDSDNDGTPCARVFRAGDALVKSDLAPSSLLDHGPVKISVVEGPVHFACIAPDVFRRTVGKVLSSRAIIFPLASCLQILSQPLEARTRRDIRFLCQHVSCFGLSNRGVGGCFEQISREDKRRLCRRFELQYVRQGQPICVQGEQGWCYYMLITGSASVYSRESNKLSHEDKGVLAAFKPASVTKRSCLQQFLSASMNDSDCDGDNKTEDCESEREDDVAEYDEAIGFLVRVLSMGDSFGERPLAFDAPHSASVFAHRDCLLLVLDAEGFDEMAERGLILKAELSLELTNLAHHKRSPRVTRLLHNYINSFPFFKMAGAAACSLLLPGVRMVQYGEREAVFRQGQECEYFYAVGCGRIALFAAQRATTPKSTALYPGRSTTSKADDDNCASIACNRCLVPSAADVGLSGGETCIAVITAGEVFGCEGLLSETSVARPHTAIALEANTQLLKVHQDYVFEWHRQQEESCDHALPAVQKMLGALQSRHVLRHVPCAARTEDDVCLVQATLRERQLFEQFNEKIMRELCKCSSVYRVSRGELIWRQGDAAGRQQQQLVYFILQGTVAVYHNLHVRQMLKRTFDRILDSSCLDHRADPGVGLCRTMRALHELTAKASSFADMDTYGVRMGYGKCFATLQAGDSFGEHNDGQGTRAMWTATLVAREATDLLVLSEAHFARIFEGAHVPSSHMRPSLLKVRLAQLDNLQYLHQCHRSIDNRIVPSPQQSSLQMAVNFYPVLRRSLYTELLRCAAPFRDVTDAELEKLLPYVQCQLYAPGEIVLEANSTVVSIFLVLFGVVEMFANDVESRSSIGELAVGNQFGHLPLLWDETVNPVGYRARSTVLCAMVDRATYRKHWHTLYDADEVKLATFLREMPLLRTLSLYDVLCIRARLERIDLMRGALKRDCDMADDVYFIFKGECRLMAFREGHYRSDALRLFGQMPRAVTVAAAGEQVATLGRFNVFCDSSRVGASLALYAATATTVLRCSLAYLKQSYPALLDTLHASTELMLEWSYNNVLRRAKDKSLTKDVELAEDGRQLVRKMLFEQPKSCFPSSTTILPSVVVTSTATPAKSLACYKRRRLLSNGSLDASDARRPRDFLHPIKSSLPRDRIQVAPVSTSFNSNCLTLNQAKRLLAKDQGSYKVDSPTQRSGVVRKAENTRQATKCCETFIADPIAYYRAAQSAISKRAFIPLPTLPRLYRHRRLDSPRHSALTPLMV